jgi:3-dehydroquinate dehydratase/shikimate dehydrogenase
LDCSCTIPHKEAAVKCCDEVDPIARVISSSLLFCYSIYRITEPCKTPRVTFGSMVFFQDIGAVNTIIRKPDGKLVGYNTDYVGAISAIEDGIRGLYMSLYIGIYYC